MDLFSSEVIIDQFDFINQMNKRINIIKDIWRESRDSYISTLGSGKTNRKAHQSVG